MEKGMQRVMLGILSFMVGAIALCLVFAIQKYNIELQSRLNGYLLPILVGGVWGLIFGFWGWQLKQGKEQNQRLNLILDAIRNVSHLLVHEKDRTKLLNAICENLVKNRGYHNAWLAVFDESGGLPTISQKGLEKDLLPIAEGIRDGRMINCIKKASVKSGVVITGNPSSACPDCPLSQNYINRGAMTVRLEYGQKVYGILTVSTAKDFIGDLFEHELFEEIAGDIGYALNSLELEEKNARLQIEQQKIIQERGERIKELNCLFGISRLIEKRGSQLEEIIQGIVDLIPPALQYPQIACARITLDEQEFKTDRFEETVWRQQFDITVKDDRRGKVEVFYREKIPQFNEGPFLSEEKNLIDAVAERLGKIIERREAEAALRESEKRFRDLVENSLTGISIIQNDQIVYQNQEQERLLGPLPRSSVLGDFEYIHPDDVEEVKRLNQGIVSGDIRSLDIEFRLLPQNGTSGNRDIKWIYCRTISTEYRGKNPFW